jgi:ribonuclease PH
MVDKRPDGRVPDQLRPVIFQPEFTALPSGSVLAKFGDTHLLCTVSVERGVPKWLQDQNQGWLTAEYRMLPGATVPRQKRETSQLSGRTQEIQRLIGRSLRAALDLSLIPNHTISVDVDVLQADGGTRTGGITASFVALQAAMTKLFSQGFLPANPIKQVIAAVSVGLMEHTCLLDLNYAEDSQAAVDLNVVMNDQLQLIEVQGTAETRAYSRSQLNQMLELAEQGITKLQQLQTLALSSKV